MKKILFAMTFTFVCLAVNAQTDTTLQEFAGKYKFADGNPIAEMTLIVDNGILMGSSSQGNSEFKPTTTADVFEIVAFSGTATFRRKDGKVLGIFIQVQGISMEGTKSDE